MRDFTIIGSGAGGSSAALELLENGYSVEVFEEGCKYDLTDDGMMQGLTSLWRNNGINLFYGNPILNFGEGKCLGGSTVINGGVIVNTQKRILYDWDKIIGEKFFLEDDFLKISEDIKKKLVPHRSNNNISKISSSSKILIDAANKKNYLSKSTNLAFNSLDIENNGPFGCSRGAKNSLDRNYHKSIKSLNGRIVPNSRVIELIRKNNKITEIVIEDTKTRKKKFHKVKNLILSAGPTQTPKIILINNLSKRVNPINFHMNLKILCFYENEIDSYRSSLLTHHVREFENDGVLFMSSNYIKPLIASYLSNQSANSIKNLMSQYKNGSVFNCQIQPNFSHAQINKTFTKKDIKIFWKLDDRDFLKIKKYLKILTELIFLSGAKKVLLPIENSTVIFSKFDQAIKEIHNLKKKDIEITSVHAMSSCGLNKKENNIVNNFGLLRNYENIYVMDSSLLPTNTGQHPQLTVMSLVKKLIQKNIELNKFKI